jgi:RNA polymerase sigma factor (sigma-70 family)
MADQHLAETYAEHRRAALAVAYRMLGSFGDAEDVVQEAFLRLRSALERGIRPDDERAYVVRITTRLAIDHLRSARVRREQYVGPWLPEPAVEGLTDLADDAVLADSLSTAFLLLLERLTPEQRAVLLLRDVFDHSFAEIAEILGRTEESCRQLAVRARRRVRDERPRFHPARAEVEDLSTRFFAAARRGDVDGLVAMLAQDAEFVGDGGDSRRGVARVLTGPVQVARIVSAGVRRAVELYAELEPTWVGSQPAVLIIGPDGALIGVWSLVVAGAEVRAVHGVVNPAKLSHLGPVLTDWPASSRRATPSSERPHQ